MDIAANCIDDAGLRRLVGGTLPNTQVAETLDHLETCDSCLSRLSSIEEADPFFSALRQLHAPSDFDDLPARELAALKSRLKGLISKAANRGASPNHDAASGNETICQEQGTARDQSAATDTVYPHAETNLAMGLLQPPQEEDEIGRIGDYRVFRVLGRGGMGVVFEAEDIHLRRRVALKVMTPAMASHPTACQRFLREARAAAKVKDDHVVTIYQVNGDKGVPFLAMEILSGESLDDRLKREAPLPVAEILRIGREIAQGLHAAHRCGLIHRDIKPANIWLDSDTGRVKILDFGLARAQEEEIKLTQENAVIGTPAFMAPEQARGEPLTAQSDLFSLGCVLYFMASGQLPFKASTTIATLNAINTSQPPAPAAANSKIPKELSRVIMKLLEKQPADRPASALVVAEFLKAIDPNSRVAAIEQRHASAEKPTRRASWRWVCLATMLALVPVWFTCGATIIRFATNKGEVVIETDSPEIEVSVKEKDGQRMAVVVDRKSGREYQLRPGDYEIEVTLKDTVGDLKFLTKQFTLVRGGTKTIDARLELAAAKPTNEQPAVGKTVASHLAPTETTGPLNDQSIVTRPAKIVGATRWTISSLVGRGRVWGSAPVPCDLSSDDATIAVGGADGAVRLFDANDLRLRKVLLGPIAGDIGSVAWASDGKTLAVTFSNGIYIWDTVSGNILKQFKREYVNGPNARWSPDGKYLRVGDNVTSWILESSTGQFHELPEKNDKHGAFAWSPDGKRFATASETGEILIWDAITRLPVSHLPGHPMREVYALAWSPDGRRIASATARDKTRVWDAVKLVLAAEGTDRYVDGSIAWSKDSKTLVVCADIDGLPDTAAFYAWEPGSRVDPQKLIRKGRLDPVLCRSDGKGLVGAIQGNGQIVSFSDFRENIVAATSPVQGRVRRCAWAPKNDRIAIVTDYSTRDRGFGIWDLESCRSSRSRKLVQDLDFPSWHPDGKDVCVHGSDNCIDLLDAATFDATKKIHCPNEITYVSSSPDGKWAMGVERYKEEDIFLADLSTGRIIRTLHSLERINSVVWSPDSTMLATGHSSKIRILDIATGNVETVIESAKEDRVGRLAWSPNGKLLAANWCQEISFWQVPSGKIISRCFSHAARALGWAADSASLAFAGESGEVMRLRPGKTGREELPAIGGGGWHAFSSDSGLVASWRENGPTLWVRETETGRDLGVVSIFGPQDDWLLVSPEGHYRGGPGIEKHIVYVAQTATGQETFTPAEFAARFGWKNDPERVRPIVGK
jgi:WD40 repeat protein/tRNA A-37 threonylcarbamoyl transferase component Bud32